MGESLPSELYHPVRCENSVLYIGLYIYRDLYIRSLYIAPIYIEALYEALDVDPLYIGAYLYSPIQGSVYIYIYIWPQCTWTPCKMCNCVRRA